MAPSPSHSVPPGRIPLAALVMSLLASPADALCKGPEACAALAVGMFTLISANLHVAILIPSSAILSTGFCAAKGMDNCLTRCCAGCLSGCCIQCGCLWAASAFVLAALQFALCIYVGWSIFSRADRPDLWPWLVLNVFMAVADLLVGWGTMLLRRLLLNSSKDAEASPDKGPATA
mmetsp:Transcript_67483/g.152640  ORF Transcript_67483/g.152640 Transcript_67483/m.152640 type:complete len:176 (+) Transcript_67483:63-590(+)